MPLIDAPSWGVFSLLTGPTALAVLAVIVGAWRRWWSLPAAVLAANLTSHVLKRLIGRERPPAEQWLVEASNYSLPSGHATGAAAFAMALTLIIGWRAWSLLAWVGALVIGLSRLALGVHWVEDVLTGWILGVIVATVTWWISLKLTPGKRL